MCIHVLAYIANKIDDRQRSYLALTFSERYKKWDPKDIERQRLLLEPHGGRAPTATALKSMCLRGPFPGHTYTDVRYKLYQLRKAMPA